MPDLVGGNFKDTLAKIGWMRDNHIYDTIGAWFRGQSQIHNID